MCELPDQMINHVFSLEQFEALASGGGGPDTVRSLLAGEYSRRLLLLRELLDRAADAPEFLGPLPSASAAWDALTRIHGQVPTAIRSVLLQPQVGTWMTHSIRRVRGRAPRVGPDWAEVGHVHTLAVAAAVRAGLPLRTQVPVRHGGVLLPTLGLARFPSIDGFAVADASVVDGTCCLRVGDDEVVVPSDPSADSTRWWGLRRFRCGSGNRVLTVSLDDIDSYRNLADPVRPSRLDDQAVQTWQRLLEAAWEVLVRWHPATADAIAAGLISIAPLPVDPAWVIRSASTGDGFGGVLMSLPPDPVTMAVTMIHEFQHVKLGGLLHLTTLFDDDDNLEDLYAPWRPDPRPLTGLMQGAYAFFGITEFWRTQRRVDSEAGKRIADFEFAYGRRQTWTGLRTLSRSGRLTELGATLVHRLMERLRPWLAEPVAYEPARAAWAAAIDHRAGWRIRNLAADPAWVARSARAWCGRGDPPPIEPARPEVRTGGPIWTHGRVAQYRILLGTPDQRGNRLSGFPHANWSAPSVTFADIALMGGELARAISEYLARISADLTDLDAWTGLGLALAAMGGTVAWRPLLNRPELVHAVYQELVHQSVPPPSPVDLARWLAELPRHRSTKAEGPCRSRHVRSAGR
jgi:HEXXH motif-containing protein